MMMMLVIVNGDDDDSKSEIVTYISSEFMYFVSPCRGIFSPRFLHSLY